MLTMRSHYNYITTCFAIRLTEFRFIKIHIGAQQSPGIPHEFLKKDVSSNTLIETHPYHFIFTDTEPPAI